MLDIEREDELIDYLRRNGRVAAAEPVEVRVLAGGVSNRTVLVTRPGGQAWVLKQALAKLRVQADWFADPARVHLEALGIRWLEQLAPAGATAPLVFEDEAEHLLAMQAVPQPHENWKTMLLAGRIEPAHIEQFGRLLGAIHRRSHERRGELAAAFDDRSFFESLRVEPYYTYTAGQRPAARRFLERLIDHTRRRRVCIVHGDYSPKNILVQAGRLVLLDHEVIHWGDPAFDLGFSLTHLLSKAHHLPEHRQAFAAAAQRYFAAYLHELGGGVPWRSDLEPWAVNHTLGCLLARVAGRSPLEYLGPEQRLQQAEVVEELMSRPPAGVPELIEAFLERIEQWRGSSD